MMTSELLLLDRQKDFLNKLTRAPPLVLLLLLLGATITLLLLLLLLLLTQIQNGVMSCLAVSEWWDRIGRRPGGIHITSPE